MGVPTMGVKTWIGYQSSPISSASETESRSIATLSFGKPITRKPLVNISGAERSRIAALRKLSTVPGFFIIFSISGLPDSMPILKPTQPEATQARSSSGERAAAMIPFEASHVIPS